MISSTRKSSAFALAGAFATVIAMGIAPGTANAADDMEKCYGISKAAENDCAIKGANGCAGQSKVDYDGKAWKSVKTGTCTAIEVDIKNAAGTMEKRKGSLAEISAG